MEDPTEFQFIKGYENLYKINRNGDVWSCIYQKVMKPQLCHNGYLWVSLRKEKVSHKGRIHRLLGLEYIENPNNLPQIDHIDRNKLNNALDNLRWVTHTDNMRNKANYKDNLTEEQKEQKVQDLKEYKRLWAEKNRRNNGIEEKKHLTEEEKRAYKYEWMRLKRANMTQEERDAMNAKRREARKK